MLSFRNKTCVICFQISLSQFFFFLKGRRVHFKCRRMLTRGRLRCTRAQRVRPGSSASPLQIVVTCSGRRPKALAPLRIQEPRNLPRAWSAVRSPAGVQQSSEHAARVTPLLLPRVLTVASHLPLYMRTSLRDDQIIQRRKAATIQERPTASIDRRVRIRCA